MCFINLLKWLTELRETFYLLCYQFIIERYNLEIVRWKMYMVQGMGKRHGTSMIFLGAPFSPYLHLCNTPKLFEPHPFDSTFRLSLFLRGQGVETESPNIIFMTGSPGNQSSSLSTFQKSLIILKPVVKESGLLGIMTPISPEAILRIENKTRDHILCKRCSHCSYHSGNFKGWGRILINHNITHPGSSWIEPGNL